MQESKPETVLILRACRRDGSSRPSNVAGSPMFRWPESGPVEAPDWRADKNCGWGLHGWLWGEGDLQTCDYWNDDGVKWLVVEVKKSDVVELDGKVKFPRGVVVFCGSREDAARYVTENGPGGKSVIFGTATAGDGGTATAGDAGTATAGYAGTATAGYAGTATAGDAGTATAGDAGTATAGTRGTATAGTRGTATAGDGGTATAGTRGTATAGDAGTATAGDAGTATAGYAGTATAGENGSIILMFWDTQKSKYRRVIGEIGENGILANTPYVLDERGNLIVKK